MTDRGLKCMDKDSVWTRTNESERVLEGAVGKLVITGRGLGSEGQVSQV